MKNIILSNSSSFKDFKQLIGKFDDDFGHSYNQTIKTWCYEIPGRDDKNEFWKVYLIYSILPSIVNPIGICGIYSLDGLKTDELFLGWFAILPEFRNCGYGKEALSRLEDKAKNDFGCKIIRSYVDKNLKPINFYKRNGYTLDGCVTDFIKKRPNIDFNSNFEDMDDIMIYKNL